MIVSAGARAGGGGHARQRRRGLTARRWQAGADGEHVHERARGGRGVELVAEDLDDALAGQMIALLEGAEFHGQKIDPQQSQSLVQQGQALLDAVNAVTTVATASANTMFHGVALARR